MTVVAILEAAQLTSTRHAEDRRDGSSGAAHLYVGDTSGDLHVRRDVEATVVALYEPQPTVRVRVRDAGEVHELVTLDGLPAALVLPATHLDDDVHDEQLCPAVATRRAAGAGRSRQDGGVSDVLLVTGPPGAGKSTLATVLAGAGEPAALVTPPAQSGGVTSAPGASAMPTCDSQRCWWGQVPDLPFGAVSTTLR
ncbi:ABC transporter ATP-binding protein [Goekera deserti]|uniref:Uncharacterized protein n=1 Tax=Goekera deserti TaxID=2497753 RepID=A0A7K3WGM0_9ACTN|nr:ABC transporter ATP-binding protein [Goekera deserti]NDI46413.1 hypothetical protein [Goekera deserti]NEL54653.1 hypothetical protein [Goekera deserti]